MELIDNLEGGDAHDGFVVNLWYQSASAALYNGKCVLTGTPRIPDSTDFPKDSVKRAIEGAFDIF